MSATQKDAGRVLATLTGLDDLPRLTWSVHPYDGAGLLGQPFGVIEDAAVAVVAAWASHLGVEATTTREPTYVAVEALGVVDGVPVRIFTHTDRTTTYVQVPIEQDGAGQ